jgi:hypothetical protein
VKKAIRDGGFTFQILFQGKREALMAWMLMGDILLKSYGRVLQISVGAGFCRLYGVIYLRLEKKIDLAFQASFIG